MDKIGKHREILTGERVHVVRGEETFVMRVLEVQPDAVIGEQVEFDTRTGLWLSHYNEGSEHPTARMAWKSELTHVIA